MIADTYVILRWSDSAPVDHWLGSPGRPPLDLRLLPMDGGGQVTARDEVIEAMRRSLIEHFVSVDIFGGADDEELGWMVDAVIPLAARLAIEQGSLQLYEPLAGSTPEPLYRVVGS